MIVSKVKKIIRGHTKIPVYDILGILDNHNFLANDIVVHNCDESIRFACIIGDTKIKTPNGNIKIKNLVNKENFEVYSYNEKTKQEEIQIAKKCIKVREDIVYEIETEDGHKIQATKEHKFLTINGWKKLGELKEGDELEDIKLKKILIKSIKKIGKKNVYDILDVLKNNNYIGNNFLLHNSSQDWAKRENKELKKKLAQIRTKHLLFILCFPLKIYKLEKTYLESFVNYWCLSKDTKITIRNKNKQIEQKPIYQLVNEKEYEVKTYNIEKNIFEFKKPHKTIKTKTGAEVYEVKLVNGISVKATKEHLFLTTNGYKKLMNLTLNDNIRTITLPYKIESIKKLKEKEDVYDILGVEDNHNLVANNMVVHNCDLFGRGKGAIYVKDKNPVMDSWRMKDFNKIGSYTEFTSLSQVSEKLRKHPNFWTLIKFPRPPDWLYNRYLKVREKNVYDDENVLANVSREDVHRAVLLLTLRDIMLNDQTLTMNRISIHIKNNYDMALTKNIINNIVSDSEQLINKVREQALTFDNEKPIEVVEDDAITE